MACPDCGSWTVKADRGLSGRLVCGRCGRPLGIGAARRRRGRFFLAPPRRGGARRPPRVAVVGLLCRLGFTGNEHMPNLFPDKS
jgi:hypothetical protein